MQKIVGLFVAPSGSTRSAAVGFARSVGGTPMRRRKSGMVFLSAAFALSLASLCTSQSAWKPDHAVEIVVVSAPGGGNDKTGRTMQRIWQDAHWLENAVVVNKVGGGGAVAYTYANRRPGDAHTVAIARTGLLSNHILGLSRLNYTDLTPLAMMGSEAMALAVRADSPIKSVKDLVARWKADPQSVSISLGSTRGAPTQYVLAQLARASGVDARKLKVLTFGGASDSVTNLLGGHIDLASIAPGNVTEHYKAGTLRIIGIATARRSVMLPDVPTLREQGFDIIQGNWTAIMGPAGLAPAQVEYWEELLERTANHAQWKRYLEADSVEWTFTKSEPTREFLRKDYEAIRGLLADLGMIKQ
jgi:putative tricarboxylic transport membrane protein